MSLQQIREHIQGRPMRGWQWLVVALGVLVNMLDGFDLLAASLVAPIISREWQLDQKTVGFMLGAVSLGTAFGAFALSAIADVWGRRTAILINLCLMSVGMLVSATADSVELLIAMRFLTGMGVGAMAGCVGVLIFEYSSVKYRNLALGMVVVGYNAGGLLGAFFANAFLNQYSWGSLFVLGGVLTVLLIPLIYFVMPESLEFQATKPNAGTLPRFNRILRRLQLQPVDTLPAPTPKAVQSSAFDLLRPPILSRQVLIGASYFLYMMSSYFFMQWNNKLTTDAGYSDHDGRLISTLTSVGGIAGGLLVGWLSSRLPFRSTAAFTLIAMGLTIAVFGGAATSFGFALACALLVGFCVFGAAVVIYATAAATFPARVRATGIGFAMGAGRLGSALGPMFAGMMLDAKAGRMMTCVLLGMPVIASAFVLRKVPLTPLKDE